MLQAVLTARRLSKSGAPLSECEDATFPSPEQSGPVSVGKGGVSVAVADGATTYSYSQEWAQIVCQAQAAELLSCADDLLARLPGWQQTWQDAIQDRVANLPWFAAAKVEQGAFSTLLRLTLQPEGTWRALAIGDSCLVQCRNGKLVQREGPYPVFFPLQTSEAFAARPYLLPTRKELLPRIAEYVRETAGTWRPGDEFLLMTDALAAWFIGEFEQGRSPQGTLRTFVEVDAVKDQVQEAEVQVAHVEADVSMAVETPSEQTAPEFFPSLLANLYPKQAKCEGTAEPLSPDITMTAATVPDLDATFSAWAEQSKLAGVLKDDDVSFVHIRLTLEDGLA